MLKEAGNIQPLLSNFGVQYAWFIEISQVLEGLNYPVVSPSYLFHP
jgi:hypothetical protein